MNLRVGIADDHPMVLEGLYRMLEQMEEVKEILPYASGQEMREGMMQAQVDVLFLDINLTDANGVDLCAEIKQNHPHTKIIALTSYNEAAITRSFMRAGGDGFLLKTSSKAQVIEALTRVVSGENYLHPEVQQTLIHGKTLQSTPSFLPKLTRREAEVLRLIVQSYTTKQIADVLCLGTKTVETHRKNLLLKTSTKNTAGLVKAALERGLV